MRLRLLLPVLLALVFTTPAHAHLGSPDVFFEGKAGPWPARVTIRMPTVVPGRAEILVQVQSREPVSVSFTPLAGRIAASNAPPPELAQPVRGETNLYTGDLWLMTSGPYSISVRIHGAAGEGTLQIPVNSVATALLPLPSWLGGILLALGVLLFCGAVATVAAAAGQSIVPPGVLPGKRERLRSWVAGAITVVVLVAALVGGKTWWNAEARDFRVRLRSGGWPELAADVRVGDSQRILHFTLGKNANGANVNLPLAFDHGKLLHLFLAALPNHQAFAHLHPVRRGSNSFEVALPPLPEGDYQIFCDLTLDDGRSSTATNTVHLPPLPAPVTAAIATTNSLDPDPDDSWAADSSVAVRENPGGDTVCKLPGGTQLIWKTHAALRANQDAGLQFEVRDPAGQPAALEPYLGMLSHAAVFRADDRVFSHLHPAGNFSMAAQMYFDAKLAKESGARPADVAMPAGMDHSMIMMDHSKMNHSMGQMSADVPSAFSLPYEFPTSGDYRLWVQIKIGGQIMTGIFDVTVK